MLTASDDTIPSSSRLVPIRTEQAVHLNGDLIELHKGDRWVKNSVTTPVMVNRQHVLYIESYDGGDQTILYFSKDTFIRVIEPYDVVAAALQRAGA